HRTEGVFDERSRVLFTVVRIEDPYALLGSTTHTLPLRIGTFVNANISGREIENLITLPRHILRPGNLVWVIDKDMKLQNRKVTVLRTGGDSIYVSAGLNDGDLVSLTSLDATFSGAPVKIISQTTTTPAGEAEQAL
ncbi:MAG: efflux RND transporter periplasmic adaptor subunit, partial [Proteobacteria bacterium]|nr:efflux RND transporter periplasmic adaptor subunit [Pseudomonadota bacterium]